MKLSQLFSGEVRTESKVSTQPTPAQTEALNRQIRSLVPGQTISGEIVSRNGSELQIRLSDDMVLNARVDRNMNIEIGKNMTFEVKNNGSTLTLSPLFTNVSTDVNVLKAIEMAGLPANRTSIEMTEQLMAAGMPVNRNSLQQIFREINNFPQGTVSDIINLHRLQLSVNEANVNQMISYRNLNHQLTGGMDAILEALPEVFDSMLSEGDVPGAVKLFQEVLQLLQENGAAQPLVSGEEMTADGTAAGVAMEGAAVTTEVLMEDAALKAETEGAAGTSLENPSVAGALTEVIQTESTQLESEQPQNTQLQSAQPQSGWIEGSPLGSTQPQDTGMLSQEMRAAVADAVLNAADSMHLQGKELSGIQEQVQQFAQGQDGINQLFEALNTLADKAQFSAASMQAFERLISGREFRELAANQLKNSWTIRPEDLASTRKVEELYSRIARQLKGLNQALENAGQVDSVAYKATSAMSQNIDFLQQINQMYAYVQLPLRLQQRDTHGELYVYANKRNLAEKDGTVSALLHLDMEHLGPVDVYVALRDSKVNTKFYLRDDEMIDFIAAHMDILTERLQKRGYDCSFSMTVRGEKEGEDTEGGLEPILRQEKGIALSQYAFDVRT